jgi:uncharacterized membrane protein YqiK
MKTGWKIFLIVLVMIILLIVAYIALTIYQLSQIGKLVKDASFQEEMKNEVEGLANGSCSYLPLLKEKEARINSVLKYACINPVVKYLISKSSPGGKDICNEFEDSESETRTFIKNAEEFCQGK